MANKVIKTVDLLPEIFRTDKNSKFLSSTIDQLIQPPQLERIDGFIGSKLTPTYNPTSDVYISEGLNLRRDYQLEPALIVNDKNGNIQDVIAFDDLINEISTRGGINNNLDRLFRSEFYSYDPQIDWDKLVNYQEYYWLPSGPDVILIVDNSLDLDADIIGQVTYTSSSGIVLSNGMKVKFSGTNIPDSYVDVEWIVEGVGSSIVLIDFRTLAAPDMIASLYDDDFDASGFDSFPFDNYKNLPIDPDYITINRASRDLNPWTRYNRWVHSGVIKASAIANGVEPEYPADKRAKRPIIEFKANLKLFNFGTVAVKNVDFIDTDTLDAFSTVVGSAGYYVDGQLLEQGHRVIFNADTDVSVRGKIFEVNYVITNGVSRLALVPTSDHTPDTFASVSIVNGDVNSGSSWWFNGDAWEYSQQHTYLNQPPLFDLFDNQGISYADKSQYISDFTGNKIFSYEIGTGVNDTVLGFPLTYRNSIGVGSYLFKNYFMTETINIVENQNNIILPSGIAYCKFSNILGDQYSNAWTISEGYAIPILQFQVTSDVTSSIVITSTNTSNAIMVDVFVNSTKLSSGSYSVSLIDKKYTVVFNDSIPADSAVLLKIYTKSAPINSGYYEPPLGLTNNPLNGPISSLTLSELSNHLMTMTEESPEFAGTFPGESNLRDLSGIEKYGRRLISNANPISFAQMFIGKKEHNVIDAISTVGNQYNQFKFNLLRAIERADSQLTASANLDNVLKEINADKNILASYYQSDMIGYGEDKTTRNWVVTDSRNVTYPISADYNPSVLSMRSVLVYLNGSLLLLDSEYVFNVYDSSITILIGLSKGDSIVVSDYPSTEGNFVPPTPTKLGLFPKFSPSIYLDDTYSTPTNVIQGHDGSITVAYNDFRDGILLEFEKRVYNNLKSQYRSELFDIASFMPGAFRTTEYSLSEVNKILQTDFIKWAGTYGVDYSANTTFNVEEPFTWNYTGAYNPALGTNVTGHWRAVYKNLFDTDRPHSHPWEMLGFSEMPAWWEDEYGPAPYTSGNELLWTDIEQGIIRQGTLAGVNSLYARPGLSELLPVTEIGDLIDPSVILGNVTAYNRRQDWTAGDQGPAETAWRRSSFWPFAVQRLLALTKPATYTAFMYDPSRMQKNIAGQWTYGNNLDFLDIQTLPIHGENDMITNGYSVYISEVGKQRSAAYIATLRSDLSYLGFNMFHKVGGFISKDKLQIIIDAIDPVSTSQGALLNPEDYNLILNVSNPIKSASMSGLIIQKSNGKFKIKGYDSNNPYFNVLSPVRNLNTPTLTVGGVSEPYVLWENSSTSGATGLTSEDVATASAAATGRFYQAGQFVKYGNNFYRVLIGHRSGSSFNESYFQTVPALPLTGGATVQTAFRFTSSVNQIPYGAEFSNIQDVYDLIVGYGKWLETEGFIFNQYNKDFGTAIDWNFTAKEFLYWTLQNWADNSVITLSPFADKIEYSLPNSVVDNVFDSFYEYNILQANGLPVPQKNINISRNEGLCTVTTTNTTEGIYFITLHSVQKEHGMVFNNNTIFNDTIYSVESGYRQRRMKLSGFRTANWNGDYFSPGFVYDTAKISNWAQYTDYLAGDVVRFSGKYYSATKNVIGTQSFDFTKWDVLGEKPVAGLIPNFDYKINQFEDFYSLDIDNFDSAQQKMAQHLTGYTPRVYLNNIFTNPIAQYKFYQGFIREKGTKNAISKLAKATINNRQGEITYNEEWAFRIGQYGSYNTYQELEIPLQEGQFTDNPQVVVFANEVPSQTPNDLKYYSTSSDWSFVPEDYVPANSFSVNLGTYLENDLVLTTAGYARIDDVTATAYSENSLLDIANNRDINEGDVIWLGFKQNGDWDVLRYTKNTAGIIGVFVSSPGNDITFITNSHHKLNVGDVISITEFNDQVDGVYAVQDIPALDRIVVASTLNSITNAEISAPGLIFTFLSFRFSEFDRLPDDNTLLNLPTGTKVWVDDNGTGKWVVYEKVSNYTSTVATSAVNVPDQKLGWSISKRKGSNIVVVGSPGFVFNNDYGRVSFYSQTETGLSRQFVFHLIENNAVPQTLPATPAEFGYSVVYDDTEFNNTGYGLIYTGAPSAQTTSTYVQDGIVKISSVDIIVGNELQEALIQNPAHANFARFGSSMYVQRDSATSNKLLVVGAPYTATTGTGVVRKFTVNSTASVTVTHVGSVTAPVTLTTGSQWGYSISGSDDASVTAISAPGYSNSVGVVAIFTGTNLTHSQTITSPFAKDSRFGHKVLVSPDANYVFITAPYSANDNQSIGKVLVYTATNVGYVLEQQLENPIIGMNFGIDIDIDANNTTLAISAMGVNSRLRTTFDKTEYLETSFDAKSTEFYDTAVDSGTVYLYSRRFTRFVLCEELSPPNISANTEYGYQVTVDDNEVYITAPSADVGEIYKFNKIDTSIDGWKTLREQEDLVSIDTIQRSMLIDTYNETIVDYLDIIDPLKGRIAGIADQELRYKTTADPAVYSLGIAGTVNDSNTNWLDDHVGELWWDLSTAKYQWYEQGDATFRKNQWGQLFPGAMIDVYEWVGSPLLPSEWSAVADTAAGLTDGISGQPKFVDNSVISVKQVFDSVTGSFSNYYYYWVKNKLTIPAVANRRISSYEVSNIIADPTAYGLKYITILSKDSIALANIGNTLVDNRISLNIAIDSLNSDIPRHTEWLLLQEGSANSTPNAMLEKKLLDSLIGYDSIGNVVPDPSLNERIRYGIGIRPRQTMFKDRLSALRNLIGFINKILLENRITGQYSFNNLNARENIPSEYLNEYDQIVEDNEGLLVIDTAQIISPSLSCTVDNGKIRSVSIVNAGRGYKISPTVEIVASQGNGAIITTEIDSLGQIISATIVDAGNGYVATDLPVLKVRPFTVVVQSDTTYNGKWSNFIYDTVLSTWVRNRTQKYNTSLYWSYTDWASTDYNKFIDYAATVDNVYEINTLTVEPSQYVKVKNNGAGNYIILEKTETGVTGTFDNEYNIVFSQNGTLQIRDSIWNFAGSNFGYDQVNTYDQTLYDQTPDLELQYILSALKNDIFINELKINWNLLFFKAVKYAASEQKLLDWAFKTSFINVTNNIGELDQRPVYKLASSEYFEQYINEVKPFRTQIRNFTENYSVIEPTQSFTTDFDLPAVYNKETSKFESINLGDEILNSYPWKSWADNYAYGVSDIVVRFGGAGYTYAPAVIITPAEGDTGSGATAEAYIALGQVSFIKVLTQGSGYTRTPTITFEGGGDLDAIPAVAYAQLENGTVRKNKIEMKFDRISTFNQIGDSYATDTFVCNGSAREFVLTWVAQPNKTTIEITLNGITVLASDYTIRYYTEDYNGYNKKYSKIVFLNYVPNNSQVLKVRYIKSVNLMNATERILNYYSPTSGMPGNDLGQLIEGIEYPKTKIETLPFSYTTSWDIEYAPFGTTSWEENVSYYTTVTATSTSTVGSTAIVLSTTTGLVVGQYANIISTLTNKFSSSEVSIKKIEGSTVTFSSTLSTDVIPGDIVEFWAYNSNSAILDSAIDGGTWSTGSNRYLIGALGINPEDITIDGDGFYTPNTSYAPDELVPGQVAESLGISVYTKTPQGAPSIFSSNFVTVANTVTTISLGILPTTTASIIVTNGSSVYTYVTSATDFTAPLQFTIDYNNKNLIISSQLPQVVGYTIVGVGGGSGGDAGVIDKAVISVDAGIYSAQVHSLAELGSVKSAFVTVNGAQISAITTTTDYGYMLTYSNIDNNRAAIDVYNLPEGENTVQAWFFASEYNYFNQILEQLFDFTTETQFNLTLAHPPGNLEPAVAQVIVEQIDNSTGVRTRLLPPFVSYYMAAGNNKTFEINNSAPRGPGIYTVDNFTVRVYVNGIKLRPGFDYSVDNALNTVTLSSKVCRDGDAVAIVDLHQVTGSTFDYDLEGSTLRLSAPTLDTKIRVTTFTVHDDMLMMKERFTGTPTGRFKISRPVINVNYVWVDLNGVPLIPNQDYQLLEDMMTIQINSNYSITSSQGVVITSVSDQTLAATVLGYRVFTDIFDRTHFKRLSKKNTTYLTQPLLFTDTSIYVADASVLTPPSPSRKVPGVVIIDGERIEFWKVKNNVLSKLRRSTLGTSPSPYCEEYTKVLDQSPEQTIPFTERVLKQVQYTTSTASTYVISNTSTTLIGDGITLAVGIPSDVYNTDAAKAAAFAALKMVVGQLPEDLAYDLNGDGFVTLADAIAYLKISVGLPIGFTPSPTSNYTSLFYQTYPIPAIDQVQVYYGGRLLNKSATYYHDTTVSFDSPTANVLGSVASPFDLPITSELNNAYIVTATNQVWVYENSLLANSINGYVYNGMNYLPPEFSINTSTRQLTLNIAEGIGDNVRLVIMKKEFSNDNLWNDGISLLYSDTIPATFIKDRPAELPDSFYYGGDDTLYTESGFALTDNNKQPLKGF